MSERVVLVTGGAGNLGQAVVTTLVEAGGRVALPLYQTELPEALVTLQSSHPERIHPFALDLTTERGAKQAIRQTLEWGGRVDAVVHLVGGYAGGQRLADTVVEGWDRMMDLNLKSAWLIARFALPPMVEQGGGALVFVASRAAVSGRSGHGAYAVAKAGVITLVETIAEEYGADGVRANAVLPGTMDTQANREAMPGADWSSWTPPGAIARVIEFLASPASAAINGAAIPAYGRS